MKNAAYTCSYGCHSIYLMTSEVTQGTSRGITLAGAGHYGSIDTAQTPIFSNISYLKEELDKLDAILVPFVLFSLF